MYVYLFTWHNLKTSWARCSVTNVTLVGQLHHHTSKCRTSDWAVVFDTLEERTGWSWSKMFTITALIKQEKESTAWFSLIRIHPSVQNAQLHLVCWYMPHCFMWRWSNQVVIGVDESFHFLLSFMITHLPFILCFRLLSNFLLLVCHTWLSFISCWVHWKPSMS